MTNPRRSTRPPTRPRPAGGFERAPSTNHATAASRNASPPVERQRSLKALRSLREDPIPRPKPVRVPVQMWLPLPWGGDVPPPLTREVDDVRTVLPRTGEPQI